MKEGSLEAPTRHPLAWTDPDFYDEAKLDEELRRVFDICHGCRRCFNLCDSFPRLFDLIDESESGELDSVSSADFKPVVDACTLCDMCFLTKCPYVPPHEFNLDFPHLMLRYRAIERKKQGTPFVLKQVTETDRNGKLAAPVAGIANWATDTGNGLTRGVMQSVAGIDKRADLPKFHAKTFTRAAKSDVPEVNKDAPAYGRKAALYATCFVNYNNPDTGMAARRVLAKNGVETEVVYPSCCGMPQLEQGDIESVAKKARSVAQEMKPWIDQGYDIVALTPSCALMLKFEWPLILPNDEDVKRLSAATKDISEYVVDIAKKEGLAEGIQALDGGVTVHIACHARAQNIGQKAAEMLRLIPDTKVSVIERCSGHGGSWGIFKENYDIALKVGKPVSRQALKEANKYVVSECPLAGMHILQGMEEIEKGADAIPSQSEHPIELVAKAYGL
ncbi:MAG: heterodisulfide reductase-related iron-sulfur binding cluster [Oceanibaculum nanhaiense]|uniref:heterodisulfide reductase-related iron-sulfur binding cluster n=1 Tax=Oceanibaculum nanhaiense TaxID=1909734 RepID=UPI0025A39355|nr:heterodisulfide reductase-related iron-sulfur binding cluster [Oceanibaculum nanhaiense]MDM7945716.1 heterodisulfide reductase-related iron-sulfur binding cluster [Oceanibaculum nanhaiense]